MGGLGSCWEVLHLLWGGASAVHQDVRPTHPEIRRTVLCRPEREDHSLSHRLSSGRVLVWMVQLGGVLVFLHPSRPGPRKDSLPLLH